VTRDAFSAVTVNNSCPINCCQTHEMRSPRMPMPKAIAAKAVNAVAWSLSIVIIGTGLWAFAFDRYVPSTERYYDGFGRELHPSVLSSPGAELSPGMLWEIADTVIAIVLFGVCGSLFAFGSRLKRTSNDDKT
jgi:hypothetical protein